MKYIFYCWGFLAILWEMKVIIQTKAVQARHEALKEKKAEDYDSSEKALMLMHMLYFVWGSIGVFSSQWLFFLLLILLGMIPKKFVIHRWIDSSITIIIILFIMLNAFHLHINNIDILVRLLKFFGI